MGIRFILMGPCPFSDIFVHHNVNVGILRVAVNSRHPGRSSALRSTAIPFMASRTASETSLPFLLISAQLVELFILDHYREMDQFVLFQDGRRRDRECDRRDGMKVALIVAEETTGTLSFAQGLSHAQAM